MLVVFSEHNLQKKAQQKLEEKYQILEEYIEKNPGFKLSHQPLEQDMDAPGVIQKMISASSKAGVGPMASVAGTLAEEMREYLLGKREKQVIVENGGDLSFCVKKPFLIGLYAADSPFSNKLGLKIGKNTKLGICTSSSSVGHSISFGEADAVIAVAESTALADSAATAICNKVKGKNGVKKGIQLASKIEDLQGVIIIRKEELGTWGQLPEIVRVKG